MEKNVLVLRETLMNATRTNAIYRFCFTKFMHEMLRSVSKHLLNIFLKILKYTLVTKFQIIKNYHCIIRCFLEIKFTDIQLRWL